MMVHRGYATVSFGQVHYRYAGRRRAPVLLMLHQVPSDSAMYEALMHQLSGEFRLIAPDTPGAGLSDPIPGHIAIDTLAGALLEFIDELGIEQCAVFGHHTGAAIAAQLAVISPNTVSSMVLSGPPLLDAELKSKLPALAERIPRADSGEHLLGYWHRMQAKDPEAPLDVIERETLNAIMSGSRYESFYQAVIDHDLSAVLPRVECPVLLFAGREDPLYYRLDAARKLLRQATVQDVGTGRTYLCDTAAERLAGVLREFFVREAA